MVGRDHGGRWASPADLEDESHKTHFALIDGHLADQIFPSRPSTGKVECILADQVCDKKGQGEGISHMHCASCPAFLAPAVLNLAEIDNPDIGTAKFQDHHLPKVSGTCGS